MTGRGLVALAVAVAVGGAACDAGGGTGTEGPFTLTFSGDGTFAGAHGGQTVRAALVVPGPLQVVAVKTSSVSATADPSFTFQFGGLQPDRSYAVDYWIDSNFGGGLDGVCDAPSADHQWRFTVPSLSSDTALTAGHDPGATTDVCDAFASTLTFLAEAEFGLAHAGQAVELAVIRSSDGVIVALANAVSVEGADPAFEFEFEHLLLNGEAYHIHYWVDSNYNGGVAGQCDPPPYDHQWAVDLGTVVRDTVLVGLHDASSFTDVCSTFDD